MSIKGYYKIERAADIESSDIFSRISYLFEDSDGEIQQKYFVSKSQKDVNIIVDVLESLGFEKRVGFEGLVTIAQ